jgi:hypothetical protein
MRYYRVPSSNLYAVGYEPSTDTAGVIFHKDGTPLSEYHYPFDDKSAYSNVDAVSTILFSGSPGTCFALDLKKKPSVKLSEFSEAARELFAKEHAIIRAIASKEVVGSMVESLKANFDEGATEAMQTAVKTAIANLEAFGACLE